MKTTSLPKENLEELISESARKLKSLSESFDFKVFDGLRESQNG